MFIPQGYTRSDVILIRKDVELKGEEHTLNAPCFLPICRDNSTVTLDQSTVLYDLIRLVLWTS